MHAQGVRSTHGATGRGAQYAERNQPCYRHQDSGAHLFEAHRAQASPFQVSESAALFVETLDRFLVIMRSPLAHKQVLFCGLGFA